MALPLWSVVYEKKKYMEAAGGDEKREKQTWAMQRLP